ncbi:MAG: hypothetical protein AB8F26_09640 [Phycisphaerales bacterium]
MKAARNLWARARHQMLLGDVDGFTRDMLTIINSKRHSRMPPLLVGIMTERALDMLILSGVTRALARDPDFLSIEQLDAIVARLDRVGDPSFDPVAALEKAHGRWSLSHIFAGHEDGRLHRDTHRAIHEMFVAMASMLESIGSDFEGFPGVPQSPPRRLATLEQQVKVTEELNDAFVELASSPSDGTGPNPIRALIDRVGASEDLDRYYIVLNSARTTRSAAGGVHRNKLEHRTLLSAIAIHRYRLVSGDWPETLAALREPKVAIDPYTNEPFGYSVGEGGPKLWAAGPDRDDDDGRVMNDQSGQNAWFTLTEWAEMRTELRAAYDGDIVFFPPEPEPDREDL